MTFVPNTAPATWDILITKGSTWPGTTVLMIRDGATIIPTSATAKIYSPVDRSVLLTLSVSINGGTGLMTVASLSDATTAALTWEFGNVLLRTTESGGRVTDLLAGQVTVLNFNG